MKHTPFALFALAATACALNGANVTTLHSTGLAGEDAQDPFWTITESPNGKLTPWATVTGDYPMDVWDANTARSKWIMPERNVTEVDWQSSTWYKNFTYQTTFDLRGFDASTFALHFELGIDDVFQGFYVNGQRLDLSLIPGTKTDWMGEYTVDFGTSLVGGLNTLEVKLYNNVFVSGIRFGVIEATATPVPEPGTYALCGAASLAGLAAWRRRRRSS